jgi:hypothetical protein
VDVAAEAELAQIIEQVVAEPAGASEPVDLRGREAGVFEKIERLLQSGGDEEAAAGRQRADEELEHRGFRLAMIQVGLHHVELVKVRQQRAWALTHIRSPDCTRPCETARGGTSGLKARPAPDLRTSASFAKPYSNKASRAKRSFFTL